MKRTGKKVNNYVVVKDHIQRNVINIVNFPPIEQSGSLAQSWPTVSQQKSHKAQSQKAEL